MRALSEAQASQCENATCKQCRCRCGGAYHGAARTPIEGSGSIRAWFNALPEDDPHYLPGVRCDRCRRVRRDVAKVGPADAPRFLCKPCLRREMRNFDADALAAFLGDRLPAPEPEPATFNVERFFFRAAGLWPEDGQGA